MGINSNSVVINGDVFDFGSQVNLSLQEGPVQHESNYVYVPPRSVSPRFTGQQVYLDQLQEYFSPQDSTNEEHYMVQGDEGHERRLFLLYGQGGIGKTQIALKFAEKNSRRFWRIFWIDASSTDTIELSLRSIAEDSEAKASGVDGSVSSVLRWISRVGPRCLLVYDNADGHSDDVEKYLPTGIGGNILITSRNPNMSRIIPRDGASVDVVGMNEDDATSLLLQWVTPDHQTADAKQRATSIVKELCYLPLAVDQAGAAIKSGLCTIVTYLPLYKSHRKRLMTFRSFNGASSYGHGVYATWELSIGIIQAGTKGEHPFIDPDAAESAILIIEVFAFFHNDNILEESLKRAAESCILSDTVITGIDGGQTANGEEFLQRLVRRLLLLDNTGKWDPFPFREGIRILVSLSLIKIDANGHSYSVHPLVHAWSRDRMSDEDRRGRCCSASALLARSISWHDAKTSTSTFRRDLIPHIKSCRAYKVEAFGSEIYADQEFFHFASAYHENGFLREAADLRVKVVESRRTMLGAEHPETLISMSHLAGTYRHLGRLKEAEELLARALVLQVKKGEGHAKQTVLSTQLLALIYRSQERHKEAAELQVRALEFHRRYFGEGDERTLVSMNHLADTYGGLGRHKEAAELQMRVLELSRTVLGEEHPSTLMGMHNLACAYWSQGRHKEAEELWVRALDLKRTILGVEHPHTLMSMRTLASAYWSQGRHKEAEELRVRVLRLRQAVLGANHPDTLLSMHELGGTFGSLGRYIEAEELQVRVVELRMAELGANHPDTLKSMHTLAFTYGGLGRHNEAIELHAQVLDRRHTVLGANHRDTLRSMNSLASTYWSLGRHKEAEDLQWRVLDLQQTVLGAEDPDTKKSMDTLAVMITEQLVPSR